TGLPSNAFLIRTSQPFGMADHSGCIASKRGSTVNEPLLSMYPVLPFRVTQAMPSENAPVSSNVARSGVHPLRIHTSRCIHRPEGFRLAPEPVPQKRDGPA